ncbi:MAG: Stp1/IreP family PP2C-type Ser/Thr phosphatase [Gammaproteobacteria bacterium]|nr:Stp1/IreP family PP2C-type Ser/Thr phosphatase [Gammaproteobacteria bacterium]MDH5735034.1 Stp1/IreP family PP2C-type Ser/Thr phosphatase [Gammaproteobacteria bacterium]
MSLKSKIIITGLTDPGVVRDHNEDTIGNNPDLGLAVLADGMGGHKGGEVASALAVDTILNSLARSLNDIDLSSTDENTGYTLASIAVERAIKEANSVIYQASRRNEHYEGMGTTIVVLLFYDNRYTVAHVGDSRLYRVRNNQLELLTHDHTLLQELVDRGLYTKEEARESMKKNLVTRAVGVSATVEIDLMEDAAAVNDIYLLCSDGLNDMIEDSLIEDTIINYRSDLNKIAAELVKQAKQHGGKDNVSTLLAQPVKPFPANGNWLNKITDLFS